MKAYIRQIEYYLPENILDNNSLAAQFPEWSVAKISAKTGIDKRHIAGKDECSSDLAAAACAKLFATGTCAPGDFDFLILCTQSPDYFLPTTACILQDRLKLPQNAGAFDVNLGCSGYVYGLGVAKGLIESGQAKNVLLVTAETYSKFMRPDDKSVRTIFGDAAAASWVTGSDDDRERIGPFVYGTDGSGANNLIVKLGGIRTGCLLSEPGTYDIKSQMLYMNGPEIFNFTLRIVPDTLQKLLAASGLTIDGVDYFVLHQANKYMMEHLRDKLGLPASKFVICLDNCGNTVSSTIPIALNESQKSGSLKDDHVLALIGFGVGYSWGATLVRWHYGA